MPDGAKYAGNTNLKKTGTFALFFFLFAYLNDTLSFDVLSLSSLPLLFFTLNLTV